MKNSPDSNPGSTGSTLPIQSLKSCVLYDETGRIHLQHAVMTLQGGYEPTEEEMANEARRVLRRSSHSVPEPKALHVLHVPHGALQPGKEYRVDPTRRKLLEQDSHLEAG